MNIFAKAEQTATTTDAKKDKTNDKLIIQAPPDIDIDRLVELRIAADDLKTECAMIEGQVKDFGKRAFVEEAKKLHRNTGSFYIKGAKKKMLFIPTDKYTSKIPDGTPEELLERSVTYEMDAELVQTYGEELSKAIMSANIPDEAKAKLIVAKPKTAIKKGSIDRICDFPTLADLVITQLKG